MRLAQGEMVTPSWLYYWKSSKLCMHSCLLQSQFSHNTTHLFHCARLKILKSQTTCIKILTLQ
jgi:hypothetical protein